MACGSLVMDLQQEMPTVGFRKSQHRHHQWRRRATFRAAHLSMLFIFLSSYFRSAVINCMFFLASATISAVWLRWFLRPMSAPASSKRFAISGVPSLAAICKGYVGPDWIPFPSKLGLALPSKSSFTMLALPAAIATCKGLRPLPSCSSGSPFASKSVLIDFDLPDVANLQKFSPASANNFFASACFFASSSAFFFFSSSSSLFFLFFSSMALFFFSASSFFFFCSSSICLFSSSFRCISAMYAKWSSSLAVSSASRLRASSSCSPAAFCSTPSEALPTSSDPATPLLPPDSAPWKSTSTQQGAVVSFSAPSRTSVPFSPLSFARGASFSTAVTKAGSSAPTPSESVGLPEQQGFAPMACA
mmetsp:Transcript_98067/g.169960  ORF Transcript_98067/g.169960 Transcript_98067/m.169960 type:complete len:361 (-) Transcript_98067:17-1099(-)